MSPAIFNRVAPARQRKQKPGLDGLLAQLETYLPPDQVAGVRRAYEFGAHAHEGQKRLSGEPYISHPLAVARILADMRMDHHTLMAAILHDVIEDTPTAKEHIVEDFGEEVAQLVDGVSKLTQIKFNSRAEAQAENFRKMMLAMVQDIRVIMVKLADRLHNMRTIKHMPPAKRRRIARETLDIYVPIATRLGMNAFRVELEELGFEAMYPARYKVIARRLKKIRGHQRSALSKISNKLQVALASEDIAAQISGREKHLYSIYHKMRSKKLPLDEVLDMYGFRIIVDAVDTCYRALGIVHNVYKPVPGKFKDYIAIPKANGYQSLHTVLLGPAGTPIEVQIRTQDMERTAESGIAAHWLYKAGEGGTSSPEVRAREWLKSVLEMQKGVGSSQEFLENVKIDLFPDEVYVFTPKGDIRRLPRGATTVDFAYAVHTDMGNSCVAAKIDRRLAPLRTPLVSGQTVEIITAKKAKPNPAWLNFVVTAKARANIRHYLKSIQHGEAIDLGKRLLDRALGELSLSLKKIPADRLEKLIHEFGFKSADELFENIGLGHRPAPFAARHLLPENEPDKASEKGKTSKREAPLAIRGTEGMVLTFARCCRPIPGDKIVGYLSAGRGLMIHRDDCNNLAEYKHHPEKWIEVQWVKNLKRDFPVEIRAEVHNERGVLATIAAEISALESNIEQVEVHERDGFTSTINFLFAVHDRNHLARIMRRIRGLPAVMRLTRTKA
ncbi:MAG TPA: bifunctional GTP diphosphokinase/guanosine-3',5'-bis pyrophosphate 3'-pyrophosphohydrolase [Gammaproteobacteria bacterium]|nr:bifunctional GTP diphosphokinase/guanosine-3',5'-bis pyrophosphate 3'-pyrophosphohydrolase [Gammaproteobacteria bacterium]